MGLTKLWFICLLVQVATVLARPNNVTAHHANRDDTSDSLTPFSYTISRVNIPRTLHDPQNKRLVELLESRADCGLGTCNGSCW